MQFGLSLNDTFEAALDDAIWAESVGLQSVAMPDHVLRAQAVNPKVAANAPAPDPFIQLTAIAMATHRIRLLTLCSPVTFRHPAILLKAATELSVVSEGRFTLGLGTGYRFVEHERFGIPFPATDERFLLLEDALGYVSAGRASSNPGFHGHRHRLTDQGIAPAPTNLRLLVGGGGSVRTPTLAGRYAEEYNSFVTDLDKVKERIAIARKSFVDAGRAGDLTISIAAPLIVGPSPEGLGIEAARQAARQGLSASEYLDQQQSVGTSLIGTPAEIAERLIAFAQIGVNACYFVFDGPVDRQGIQAVRDAFNNGKPHR